ncbi:hypothetical protein SNARM312S_04016 [Streptomyces narbonensis]
MSAPAPSPLAVVDAEPLPRQEEVLTEAALAFVAELHRRFTPRRDELLARRAERRAEIARTSTLDFLPETAAIRADDSWKVAPAPAALNDRRVEITGPTDRKMTINALNSGARVWLADFEDASAPTWENVVLGQVNLIDAYTRNIDFTDARSGKSYALKPAGELATVVMRPRGWHLEERHLTFDGRPVPGALVDFGLYFFHNAQRLIDLGKGPYFYLPKTESHLEARLLERHLRLRPGLRRHPAGHRPRHGPHRDHRRRVRDGGDPLRAPRDHRPERGPLGLPLLHRQQNYR